MKLDLDVSLQKVALARGGAATYYSTAAGAALAVRSLTAALAALSHATRAAGAPAQAFPWTAKVKIQVRWGASAGRIGLSLRAVQAGRRTSVWCKGSSAAVVSKMVCDRLSIPTIQSPKPISNSNLPPLLSLACARVEVDTSQLLGGGQTKYEGALEARIWACVPARGRGESGCSASTGYSSSTQPIPSPQTQTQGEGLEESLWCACTSRWCLCRSRARASNASPPAP